MTRDEHEERLLTRRSKDSPGARRTRLCRSVSRWGRWWGNWYYVPMVIGLTGIPMCRLSAGLGQKDRSIAGVVLAIALGILMLGLVLSLVATYFAMNRDVARWRARIAQSPFAVLEYDECLSDAPDENRPQLRIQFTFAGTAPTSDQLAEMLLAVEGGWKVDLRFLATLSPGRAEYGGRDNQLLAAWFDGYLGGELLAIHARFPITSVQLLNESWG